MAAEIKEKIEEIVGKIKADPNFAKEFQSDPVKAIEKIIGADLPDGAVNSVIEGVKAKISVDGIKDKLGALGGLFGK